MNIRNGYQGDRPRAGLIALIGIVGVGLAVFLSADRAPTDGATVAAPAASADAAQATVAGMDADSVAGVQRGLAAAEYEASEDVGGLQAPNRAQNFRSHFTPTGVELRPRQERADAWRWSWRFTEWGREDRRASVAPVPPDFDARRVEYRRPGIVEWYENTEAGLEQGFTVDVAPAGEGALCIEGVLGGDLTGETGTEDGSLHFRDAHGARVLRYRKLLAWDVTGKDLPATMILAAGKIRLHIDDRDACYPVTVDPLLDTPDWIRNGYQSLANFGYCVATAGDVNGDGYSDALVSAPRVASGGSAKGRVYVYLGSPAGLEQDFDWSYLGDQTYAILGSSAATAGDVNGDGFDDVIVSAPWYDDDYNEEGRVYVFHGSADGLSTTPDWVRDGMAEGVEFGTSVASAGDVNGDGYADVIIGAPSGTHGQTEEGLAYVFHGSADGLESNWSWRGESNEDHSGFGHSVSTAGDVNADGYDDVVVGAPGYNDGSTFGHAYVYHGSAGGLSDTPAWHAGAPAYGRYGYSVAAAGDVSGDGYSDILVGSWSYSGDVSLEGRVYLYEGSSTGVQAAASWTDEGGQNNSQFAFCVATAGDINGDGYSDVLVAAKEYTHDQDEEGRVYLYMGYYDGLSADPVWYTEGDQDAAFCGWSAATAGDVNGDGFSDVIVGIPNLDVDGDEPGRAVVFHGTRSGPRTTAGWVTESNQVEARFGATLASVGDVNGDGFGDVLVGAAGFDFGQEDEGAVFLFLGTHLGLSAVPLWYAEGNQMGAALGISVACAGDVNGDGYPEAIVGARNYTHAVSDEGAAFIWFSRPGGAPYGNPANADWSAFGGQSGSDFGWSVAGAGDVNGDGFADVIVGAPYYDNPLENEGRVFVYHGSPTGPSPGYDWSRDSGNDNTEYGLSVASAGDVNGDGFSDIIVGAPKYDHPSTWEGLAFVYTGSASGLQTGAPWWYAQSDQAQARLGNCVASAGDVNGDGYSDVIIGAPRWDGAGTDNGRALVWYGQATPPPVGTGTNADWYTDLGQGSGWWGYTVGTAGDVDGDGYSDILVGSPYYDGDPGSSSGLVALWYGSPSGVVLGAASWLVEGSQENSHFGWTAGTAGDVNGDGFSDVIVGARSWSAGQADEGRAFLYYGNDSRGLSRKPSQWRVDLSAPVSVLGLTHDPQAFVLQAHGRSAMGRSQVRMEYEVKPFRVAFDGGGTVLGDWTDTGPVGGAIGSVAELSALVDGLTAGGTYHWRLRVHTDDPFFPCSPWLTLPDNAAAEMDLRTGAAGTPVGDLPAAMGGLQLSSHPNPFNPRTSLGYVLDRRRHVRLSIYDLRGRLLRVLLDEPQEAGRWSRIWDGCDDAGRSLPSGVYCARLQVDERQVGRKLTLIR